MSERLSDVRAETDRVHSACDEIELAMVGIESADEWRAALGFIDSASRRIYQTRKILLDEAIRRANEIRHEAEKESE